MSAEQLIAQGDFAGALAELRQTTAGQGADPGQLLMRFNLEVRVQAFSEAQVTMARLCTAQPELGRVMQPFLDAARAEEQATRRLVDPSLAARRSAVGMPPPHALAYVKAALLHAQGDPGAVGAIAEARAAAPPVRGTLLFADGTTKAFSNLTDTDDLTGPTLPCYEGARLLDLPYSDLREIRFAEPKTSLDVMWRPATVELVDGSRLAVRVPSFYPGTGVASEGMVRTGQMTTWDRSRGHAQGQGQRDLMASTPDGGQALVGLLNLVAIRFQNPPRSLMPAGSGPVPGGAVGGAAAGPAGARPWGSSEKAVAWGVAGLWLLRSFGLPGVARSIGLGLLEFRILAILMGLGMCAGVWWVASRVSSRNGALIATAVAFALTTLRWIV